MIYRNTRRPCIVVETFSVWSDDSSQAPRKDETQPKDSAPRSEGVRSSLDRRPVSAAIRLHHVVRALNISAGGKASQWP